MLNIQKLDQVKNLERRSLLKGLFYAGSVLSIPLSMVADLASGEEFVQPILNHDIFQNSVNLITKDADLNLQINPIFEMNDAILRSKNGKSFQLNSKTQSLLFAANTMGGTVDYFVVSSPSQEENSYQLAIFKIDYQAQKSEFMTVLKSDEISFIKSSVFVGIYSSEKDMFPYCLFRNRDEFLVTQWNNDNNCLEKISNLSSENFPGFDENSTVFGPYVGLEKTNKTIFIVQHLEDFRFSSVHLMSLEKQGGEFNFIELAAMMDETVMNDGWSVQFKNGNGVERFVTVIQPKDLSYKIMVFLTKDKVLKFCTMSKDSLHVLGEYSIIEKFENAKEINFAMKAQSMDCFYLDIDNISYELQVTTQSNNPKLNIHFQSISTEDVFKNYGDILYKIPAYYVD